ncbi:hypothetical protein LIER_09089 [Lithospermum erythrorhizon]|uniref:non-specific serine/threonine protein kinase n=1 Tax=Lithospermum erythrorhizon TaxID=34254 RepID=A0AAV3PEA2_LITER
MRFLSSNLKTTLIILFILLHLVAAQKLKTFTIEYYTFNATHYDFLVAEGSATITNEALQVTPESVNADFNMFHNSGRFVLRRSFRLYDGDIPSGNGTNNMVVASFNTSFLINIYRPENDTAAEGLAFVIVPDLEIPLNSSGQYLGLTNSTTDGNPTNKFIAVEIDTFKQEFDPDGNHIGIDINSIISEKNESLTPHGFEIAPIGAKFFNFWIDYDGVSKIMQVYIAQQAEKEGTTPPKPSSPILEYGNLDLRKHVNEYSNFGFSASTGDHTQLNCVRRWNFTVHYFPEDKKPWIHMALASGIPAILLLSLFAACFCWCLEKRKLPRTSSEIIGKLKSLPGMPREFSYKELARATNNFDERNKLGEGGFGMVYRGKLSNENKEIAVKRFSRGNLKGQDDFFDELTIINRLRHKHLVPLLGWCHKNMKLLLVYDYMPNGSLDKHLFAMGPNLQPLEWNLRLKIISGVASALHYIHNEYDQRVVHRDLKASNIMLDANFNAHLGDFGLARALDNEKTSYAEAEGIPGTMGYLAPECFHTGKATQQSDVYAFGAVVMETVCGQRPGTKIGNFQFLVDWVWSMHHDDRLLEAVDENLEDEYDVEQAERILLLGLACMNPIAADRPRTQDIVQIISGNVPPPDVSPLRPPFVWPSVLPLEIYSSAANKSYKTSLTSFTTSRYYSVHSKENLTREVNTGDSMV